MAHGEKSGHPRAIDSTVATFSPTYGRRHASPLAGALLVLSSLAGAAAVVLDLTDSRGGLLLNDPAATASQLLCFGTVGAVLIARRPDLPFGWLLAVGALADVVVVGIGVPSLLLADAGRGGQLATWGVSLGAAQFLPDVVSGLVNVRFPTGLPANRLDRWLDRLMRWGVPVALVGAVLGDTITRDAAGVLGRPLPADRFVDGTWVTPISDAASVLVPLLILVGVVAGVGVVVRCVRATGIERAQLQWRAAGAVVSLGAFPFAVAEVLPAAWFALAPVVFAATLLIPMLRYRLWSGDPLPRRRGIGLLVSRRTLVEAREEERRRLRRDLHDGLGPQLTGLRLTLDGVQAQLAQDPDKALAYLADARAASAQAIVDLRQLVHGLRPPAIDELGLVDAVRARVASLVQNHDLDVTVTAADEVSVAAAVEVAAYLCAVEAVTNVIRHSSARRCRVRIGRTGGAVVLTVDDDGEVEATWEAGVGLTAMRERAVELGGTFLASSGPHGFSVRATYPRTPA